MTRYVILIAILLFTTAYRAYSQQDNYYFYNSFEAWEGGLDFGVNSFYGDINDNTNKIFPATPFQASFYKYRHFVVGGYFGKRMTPFWTLALDMKFGRVSGKTKYGIDEHSAVAFRTSWNTEVVVSNTLDILSMCNLNTNWALYPKIGFGVYAFRSKMWDVNTGEVLGAFPGEAVFNTNRNESMATGYRAVFAMPVMLGVSYRPLPELRVFFETGITWTCTDMLDAYQSNARGFEGVWNTMIGVSYQFDFRPHLRGNPRNNTANDALKDDGVTKKYKKMRYKSNLGTGKPRYSKSSAMKKHQ